MFASDFLKILVDCKKRVTRVWQNLDVLKLENEEEMKMGTESRMGCYAVSADQEK